MIFSEKWLKNPFLKSWAKIYEEVISRLFPLWQVHLHIQHNFHFNFVYTAKQKFFNRKKFLIQDVLPHSTSVPKQVQVRILHSFVK